MRKIFETILVFIITTSFWVMISWNTNGFFGLLDKYKFVGMIVAYGVPLTISIFYFRRRKIKKQIKKEPKTLSEKYDVLEIYKVLAILLMIIASGTYIYSLIQLSELAIETKIITTISYIITIFSLFCLTKMIDFLFDLDKK